MRAGNQILNLDHHKSISTKNVITNVHHMSHGVLNDGPPSLVIATCMACLKSS